LSLPAPSTCARQISNVKVTAVWSSMDDAPISGVCVMCDDADESPARRLWVSCSSLEASLRCVGIYLTRLDLVVIFGRKPRSGVGLAWWRRPWRRNSVGSIVLEDTAWYPRLLSSGARCCPKLFWRGAMHTMAGKFKTIPSWGRPSSVTYLFRWCVDEESSFGVVVLRERPASVEMRLCCLA
jgi:hypothetical protein